MHSGSRHTIMSTDAEDPHPVIADKLERVVTDPETPFPQDAFILDMVQSSTSVEQFHIVGNLMDLNLVDFESEKDEFVSRYGDLQKAVRKCSPAEVMSFHASADHLAKFVLASHGDLPSNSDGLEVTKNGQQVTVPYGTSFDPKMKKMIFNACSDSTLKEQAREEGYI